jgi:prephenate dehydratase
MAPSGASALRVAFLGPPGTYTEEALRASAKDPFEAVSLPSVPEVVAAIRDAEVERAVVPIENSIEGSVAATLDVLADEAERVCIIGEVVHPVHHCLVGIPGARIEDVRRVLSHPQATAQCARFLRERLPSAERVAAASTAEAVRLVAEAGDPGAAALGSALAADLYSGEVLADRVEDEPDNVTRFVWLARRGDDLAGPNPGQAAKTSVVFWGFNDDSPGALVAVLGEFADRGINLTKIESRPRRVRLGHYMFFADLEGAEDDEHVAEALEGLRRRVETLRVLGSYRLD